MQILCIETGVPEGGYKAKFIPKKGETYISSKISSISKVWRNIDKWHSLEEGANNEFYHISLFIELPNQEGVVFSKKEELVEI